MRETKLKSGKAFVSNRVVKMGRMLGTEKISSEKIKRPRLTEDKKGPQRKRATKWEISKEQVFPLGKIFLCKRVKFGNTFGQYETNKQGVSKDIVKKPRKNRSRGGETAVFWRTDLYNKVKGASVIDTNEKWLYRKGLKIHKHNSGIVLVNLRRIKAIDEFW